MLNHKVGRFLAICSMVLAIVTLTAPALKAQSIVSPVISGAGPALDAPGTLNCNAGYDTYTWYVQGNATPVYTSSGPQGNMFNNPVSEKVYTVVVTKNGASAQSQPFIAPGSQSEGQNENYIIAM